MKSKFKQNLEAVAVKEVQATATQVAATINSTEVKDLAGVLPNSL